MSIARNQRRHSKKVSGIKSYVHLLTAKTPNVAHCHEQVAQVAQGLAYALYESLASDNKFYDTWKRMNPDIADNSKALHEKFAKQTWGKMLPQARATMAAMLRDPTLTHLHESIHDALMLDNSLRLGRGIRKIRMTDIVAQGQGQG